MVSVLNDQQNYKTCLNFWCNAWKYKLRKDSSYSLVSPGLPIQACYDAIGTSNNSWSWHLLLSYVTYFSTKYSWQEVIGIHILNKPTKPYFLDCSLIFILIIIRMFTGRYQVIFLNSSYIFCSYKHIQPEYFSLKHWFQSSMKVIVWPSAASAYIYDVLGNGLTLAILASWCPDGCILEYASTEHSNSYLSLLPVLE